MLLILCLISIPLLHALGEEVFNLAVDRAELILRPGCKFVVQLGGEAEGHLLFGLFAFFHGLIERPAVHHGLGLLAAAENH